MPSICDDNDDEYNGESNCPVARLPILAATATSDHLIEMMEEFRQRLHSVEEKQAHTEARVQSLSSQFPDRHSSDEAVHQCARSPHGVADTPNQETLSRQNLADQMTSVSFELGQAERTKSEVTVDFLEIETQEFYPFKQSTWDVAIFIGTPSLGVGGSGITCVLLLMNAIMHLLFLGIIWYNFSEATINETTIEDARRWRIHYAHDYQRMDLQSGLSLVARVCQNDKSLQIAASQELLYESLHNYIKPGATGWEAFFVGKLLCIAALACWYLMVSEDMHHAVDLFRAMVHLERGIDKLETVERPGHPTLYRVASISNKRVILSAIIVGYRLFLGALLAYCGTCFLVYTIETTEVVLNAVALEIILNMDDLLFAAMTTSNARYLVSKLEPLRMPRWPHRKGVDMKAISMIALIPGTIMIVYYTMISPMVDDLSSVADELCGGTQNFVYSEDSLRMMLFASTYPCTDGCRMPKNVDTSIESLGVQEAVKYGQRNKSEYAIWVGDHFALRDRKAYGFEQSVAQVSQGTCVDSLQGPYLHYMRQVLANSSISNCNDVKYWCPSASFQPEWGPDGGKGLMARLFCPRTCECDRPGGSLIFISGCPAVCTSKTDPAYAQRLKVSHGWCLERSHHNLTNSIDWMAWVAQLRHFAVFKNDLAIRRYSNEMVSKGCLTARESALSRFCVWAGPYHTVFKGLAFFCPQTCMCWMPNKKPGCPDPCYFNGQVNISYLAER